MPKIHCLSCKEKTESSHPVGHVAKNGAHMIKCKCSKCGKGKSLTVPKNGQSGAGFLSSLGGLAGSALGGWAGGLF